MTTTAAAFKRYRLLTGPDDAAFCQRISDLLEQGYELHGSPAIAYDPKRHCVIAAQAVRWPADRPIPHV